MPVQSSLIHPRLAPRKTWLAASALCSRFTLGILFGLLPLFGTAAPEPQDFAFSYQGRLTLAGEPVQGTRAMSFRLFDAPVGGAQYGELTLPDVAVDAGLFVVDLDYGEGVFLGQQLWLEVQVDDQVLLPRQRIASAPYALYALEGNAGPVGPQGPKGDPATIESGNGITVGGDAASGFTVGMSGSYEGSLSVAGDLDAGNDASVGGTATMGALSVQGNSDLGTNVRMPVYFNEWTGNAATTVMLAYCDVGDILIGGGCHKNGTTIVISKMQHCPRGDTSSRPLIATNAGCTNLGPPIHGGSDTFQPSPAQDFSFFQAFWLCTFAAVDTGPAYAQATCLRSFH